MTPLKWVVVAVTVGTLLLPVVSEVPSTCDWLIPSESGCVKSAECKSSGDSINIYEDCEVGGELFTINDTSVSFDGDCPYSSGTKTVSLKKKLDAEDLNANDCDMVGRPKLYFSPVNINEFPPDPTSGTVPITEVTVKENVNSYEGPSIYYKDDDYDETKSLSCEQISGDEHLFSLRPVEDGNTVIKTFIFSVNDKLDYESKVFYNVEYKIISKDEKNNILYTTQTFFVYVQDMPDNRPVFSNIVPVYSLEECKTEDNLFSVTAQDRDVGVNYAIKYSIEEDGDGNYFMITETTGEVRRNKDIDREKLLENGISSLSLTITAKEYRPNGTEGEKPNDVQQRTTVIILDCNDNEPKFNSDSYAVEMDELTQDSRDQELNLEIVVSDMDEGINGSFKLTTSDPDHLIIAPEKGKQSEKVTLTARWKPSQNNLFDYEDRQDKTLEFTITATEDANKSHTNTANIAITLHDVNDCFPVFDKPSYAVNVSEITPKYSFLLSVAAEDGDISENFGTPSIRYKLESSCTYKFDIDSVSGNVTLNNELDYDDGSADREIHCNVMATDLNGSGLTGQSEIIITVLDEVDEPPMMDEKEIPMNVEENSQGKVVGSFTVTDLDNDADIDFRILSHVCTGDISTLGDIDKWFEVVVDARNHPKYRGIVNVIGAPDRETCNEVTLTIIAVDKNTVKNADNATGTVIITITDVKDELPQIVGDYTNLNIDEFDELQQPPPPNNVNIFTLTVTDPDEGDTINLSVSKGGNKVELSQTEVTVAPGQQAQVQVRTKNYADINREEDETIEVEIELTNPTRQDAKKENFIIKINDLNDKIPTINSHLCDNSFPLLEDDGSGSVNNTLIFTITATDEDIESPYNIVSYYLMNTQNPNSKDQRTPFMVDATTGQVTVFLTEENTLDRERDLDWELNFKARDQCQAPEREDTNCEVNSSELCKVTIIVGDVNDNNPRDLTWKPADKYLTVDDFLKNGTELKYILEAEDDDSGTNAALTYEVLGTFSITDGEDKDLFYALSDSDTCRLHAKTNFEGMMLTGWYYIVIQAKDGGGLKTDFNVSLQVVDGNDQPPQFTLSGCEGEEADNIIRMQEGDYQPGVNGTPSIMPVRCLKPNGIPFKIRITDADIDLENKEVKVEIDISNSTVENAKNGNAEEQLKYWSLDQSTCMMNCDVQLYLSHEIDREKGTAYNLSLHAKNTDQSSLQESWTMVRVVVTNRKEYDPYFCLEGNCSYVVYMPENEPNAEVFFMEATDLDNIDTGEDDDPVEEVFYFIKGGDTNYFSIYSNRQNKIILRNKPNGLDREDPISSYSLKILATNDPSGSIAPVNSSSFLHLVIRVLDKNDVVPNFKTDVIFTSFMETDTIEKRLTVIEAEDLDLNETLTYTMLDDVQWHDMDVTPPATSFTIERKDARSCYLKLDFDPKAVTQGYCNFTIHVEDAGNHANTAQVKVYSINDDFKVAMYFSNEVDEVKNKENEIEAAYTEAYGYTCVIDSITTTQTSSGETLANETTVYMHFIDDEKNKPVEKEKILELSSNADVMRKLYQELKANGIILDSVDKYQPPEGGKSAEDQILTLKILLVVVSLVLGCLLLLLIIVSWIRTRSLKRKVKVLSTNTFGSKDSGLNHMGHDVVPGSNLAQLHGNHNPVFSEDGALELKIQDTGSISSGDSELIGVEDNPEFKSYSAKGAQNSSSKGYENPSFGRSIDQVSAPVPGVQGGVKGNPLLNFSGLQDSPRPSTNSLERQVFGDPEESEGDAASLDQKINSNFSFS